MTQVITTTLTQQPFTSLLTDDSTDKSVLYQEVLLRATVCWHEHILEKLLDVPEVIQALIAGVDVSITKEELLVAAAVSDSESIVSKLLSSLTIHPDDIRTARIEHLDAEGSTKSKVYKLLSEALVKGK